MIISKKKLAAGKSNFRAHFVLFLIVFAYAAIIGRLYYVQIFLGEHYRVWAQGLQTYTQDKVRSIDRGEIFFAGGQPLAINRDFIYAYASPLNIKDKEIAAEQVSEILGIDKTDLVVKFDRKTLYALLKEKITDEEAEKIKNSGLKGVYTDKKKMRYYPQGAVAAQIAGFVGDNGNGQYGLEEYYDEELSAGEDIFLNIDYNIQYQAEQMLAASRIKLEATDAEAIVADPKTGAILAMAKSPNFDPNNYKEFANKNIEIFKNDSCQTLFEPGSVFKAVTMASALNEKKLTPRTAYFDNGKVVIGPDTLYNFGRVAYGNQTMANVLEHSVNTGAVFAGSKIGNKLFSEYIARFGVFEPTGIDLPETFSKNLEFKKGYPINFATASFGQGIWMTSAQLIRAYSALANGGQLVQLSLARDRKKDLDAQKNSRVIEKETADTITAMLAGVIDNGFGKAAKVSGYSISGKTGTAQMSWSTLNVNKRGYSDKTTQSFIGYFPSGDPKFLILVKLRAPNVDTAEYSAIPVFKDLAKYVIYVSQIPPTEEIKTPAAVGAAAATTPARPN